MNILFRFLYIGVFVSIFICVVTQMVIANQMIVLGNKLGRINQRIEEISSQNEYLKKLLAKSSSIQHVAYQAKKQGFIDAASYVAFDVESFPVAIKR